MGRRPVPSPKDVWKVANDHGWHSPSPSVPECLALIHSEVSEVLEAYRNKEDKTRIAEELADVVLRVYDLSCDLDMDIENAIWEKHHKNINRPYKHGGKLI